MTKRPGRNYATVLWSLIVAMLLIGLVASISEVAAVAVLLALLGLWIFTIVVKKVTRP